MVHNQIYHRHKTHDGADEKCLDGRGSPDDVSVESGQERESRDPDFAVPKTKLLSKRAGQAGSQRERIREPIRDIDEPRGEEKRHRVSDLKWNPEAARKQAKPRDRYQRRIQTNKVEPDGRDGALRCLRTPQRRVPTG